MFTAPSSFVPIPLPFERSSAPSLGRVGAVETIVPSQGPFPFPQTLGPPAPPGTPDHYRVAFGPGPSPLELTGSALRVKRTNAVVLGNLLIRPYQHGAWDKRMREGQILWTARNAEVASDIDNSQEVRNLPHINCTLRVKGSTAYEKLKKKIESGTSTPKEKALWFMPELATANYDFWNVRSTEPDDKRFFHEYWALSPYGILERYGWPIGVSYISPTVSSHFPMAPGVNPLNGPSFRQITVALKGECSVLNVFPHARNFSNLFLVLRRERKADETFEPYFQWTPATSFDGTPCPNDTESTDLMGVHRRVKVGTTRAHYIFFGTVQDQKGIVPGDEALKRAQGRTNEDTLAHYHANQALSVMGVTLKPRQFGFLGTA